MFLLPVQRVRNERTSTYEILCGENDITTNLPLQERLRQDFGIALPEVDEADDWAPSAYLGEVVDAVSGQSGWFVDADGMQIGFFSFAKLLMHRDLDPARIIQIIDADASQMKVIEEVRRGASLVVHGPPGTGKSQTITNLIAAAAHDGKSVLFVAEKMAVLSVVHDRLVRAGLRDICLELHSCTANKKALAQELGCTLMARAKALSGAADLSQLRATRDQLNRITALLHDPLPAAGDTPFRAVPEIVGFIGNRASPPSIPPTGLEALDRVAGDRAKSAINGFVVALGRVGAPEDHPFRGTMAQGTCQY